MKARIARIKQYLSDHRAPIAYGAGVVAGAVPTAYILSRRLEASKWIEVIIDETPEELKVLLEEAGAVRFDSRVSPQTIILASKSAEAALKE